MTLAQTFWLWYAIKILKWPHIDIKHYHDNKEKVEAVTFSFSKDYINKVSKI